MPERIFPRGRGALLFLVLAADALLLPAACWLDVLGAGALALTLLGGWCALTRRLHAADGFALIDRLPRRAARALDLLLAPILAVLALHSAGQLAVFTHSTALSESPVWLLAALTMLSGWLLARHGPPALALWALPVAWGVGIVIVLSLALSLPGWQLPPAPILTFWSAGDALRLLGGCFAQAAPLLLVTGEDRALPQTRSALTGAACGTLVLSLTSLRAIAVLGSRCAALLPAPVYTAAGVSASGILVPRSEAILGAALALCLLARCALLLTLCRACLLRLRTR